MRRGRTQKIRCMLSHHLADLSIFTDGVLSETGDKYRPPVFVLTGLHHKAVIHIPVILVVKVKSNKSAVSLAGLITNNYI